VKINTDNLVVGMTVAVMLFGGEEVTGKIVRFGEKDGRELFDLDNNHWAYLNQVIRVVNR
jgi:hypothetical protein